MIRRRVGNEFWLIAQHDHALLSGQLAQHLGNDRFARPDPREPAITGISLHDCGWPIHDDCPTLSKDRIPLDVFETSPSLGFSVWTESARRASERDPYAGLLVSLHGMALSVFATAQMFDNKQFDMNDTRVRFEVNKFQHAQIELQESLRKRVGLRTDIPLHCGIDKDSRDPHEQRLTYNFRLLQAMDKLSLCLCCTKAPFAEVEPLADRPGGQSTTLRVSRPAAEKLVVSPWPFEAAKIDLSIPFRRLPADPFADEQAFRDAYAAASVEQFTAAVVST
jgi:hypothetical protein